VFRNLHLSNFLSLSNISSATHVYIAFQRKKKRKEKKKKTEASFSELALGLLVD